MFRFLWRWVLPVLVMCVIIIEGLSGGFTLLNQPSDAAVAMGVGVLIGMMCMLWGIGRMLVMRVARTF